MKNETSSECSGVKESPGLKITSGTIRVEVIRDSKWSTLPLVFLIICGGLLVVAWKAFERSTTRILHPESKLSVLELEESVIKFDGIDGSFKGIQLVDPSTIGIKFTGFARLGIDLSKATFDLDRLRSRLIITLPEPGVTEVNIGDAHIWERKTNSAGAEELDKKECDLCNAALDDFSKVAKEPYYVDAANRLAKVVLRNYYKRNHPWLNVEFK